MSKKINYKNVISEHNKTFNKRKKVIIESDYGESYDVLYDEEISLIKLSTLIEDLLNRMKILNKYTIPYDYTMIIAILMIKYFTDIDFPEMHKGNKDEVENSFQDELTMLEGLIDLGLLKKIIDNFDDKNVKFIQNFLNDFIDSDKYKEMANLDITNTINQLIDMLAKDGSLDSILDSEEYKSLDETMEELAEIVGDDEDGKEI